MSDLRECPFCGGEAKHRNNRNLVFFVECCSCKAGTGPEMCEPDAASAWNRRSPAIAAALAGRDAVIEQCAGAATAFAEQARRYGYKTLTVAETADLIAGRIRALQTGAADG